MIVIDNKQSCCGCKACANICPKKCISMVEDEEGFWYPQVDKDKCINCGLCEKICPTINKKETKIGKRIAYAAYNKDENIRKKSSSGGIFSILAENIIQEGGVVFGAAFDSNFEVKHTYVDKIEDLEKLRTSKYVQSNIGDAYTQAKQFLDEGREVLFTGTPCQIGGLKSYLRKDYDNLITQDIICHGVPSPVILKKYIKYREDEAKSKIARINFREKIRGWKNYSLVFAFENGANYVCKSAKRDPMMKMFLHNKCLRPSCHDCAFKTRDRLSDITLADFWGVGFVAPSMDDNKGTSLVLLHSQKGVEIFDKIKDQTNFKSVDFESAIKWNKSMTNSVKPYKREKVMKDFQQMSFEKFIKKHG